jgi:hypothetical protein
MLETEVLAPTIRTLIGGIRAVDRGPEPLIAACARSAANNYKRRRTRRERAIE